MNQLPEPGNASPVQRRLNLGIRGKITVPYLVLTFAVAFVGVFIVTYFVTDSFEERFDNQLTTAAKVTADSFVRLERSHLDVWRILAATQGVAEAVRDDDPFRVRELIEGPAASRAVDSVLTVGADRRLVIGLTRASGTTYAESLDTLIEWDPLDRVLNGERDEFGDKYSGILKVADQPFLYTVGPLRVGNTIVGALIVGTRLNGAALAAADESAASISVYAPDGSELVSTLPPREGGEAENRLTPEQVNQVIARAFPSGGDEPEVLRQHLVRGSVEYRLAYGPLQIRQSIVGLYSVALQTNFVVSNSVGSRLLFAAIFGVMVVLVFVVGLAISRRLIAPILRLVSATQAVAAGNLEQRTGLSGTDEIGTLAATFDNMTQKLQERTRDLEMLLQAHREEAFKTRAILASIADGVLVLDPRGRIIMMNSAAEHILGDMATDFSIGMLRERAIDQVEPPLEGTFDALKADEVRRFEINHRTISAHAAPVITNDGQQLGTVVALRDVTREAEIDKLKDSFIEQVSHELRTPLTAVKGYTDLLLQTAGGQVPERFMELLGIVNRHTDSLVAMITELLDMSQIEAGSMNLKMERIELNELVDATLEEWRERLAEKELSLEVSPDPQATAITGDRRRLGWAIKQLLSNAYHYTEPGGQVRVTVSGNSEHAAIAVEDTGIGITPEDQKYLFTRFFRSTTRVHSNARGVGLGLYIVKAVVEAHRGKVEVKSTVDQGSTFRMLLPIRELEGEPPLMPMLQDNRA